MFKYVMLPALVVVAMAMAGCATPRYETVRHYQAPSGAEGASCVQACDRVLASCQSDCRSAWQACTAKTESKVDGRYAQALKAYADDLRRYRRELDLYEMELWMGWGHHYGGPWYSPWPYSPWRPYAFAPIPPGEPPSREAVRQSLFKAECKDDCGCQVKYDTCFTGCGGSFSFETRRLDK